MVETAFITDQGTLDSGAVGAGTLRATSRPLAPDRRLFRFVR